MATGIALCFIQKFIGSDFSTWKIHVRTALTAHGLLDITLGTWEKPTGTTATDVAAIFAWNKDNAKAMCLIASALVPDELERLKQCETAKEMWDQMLQVHEQKSSLNKMLAQQRFYEYEMDT